MIGLLTPKVALRLTAQDRATSVRRMQRDQIIADWEVEDVPDEGPTMAARPTELRATTERTPALVDHCRAIWDMAQPGCHVQPAGGARPDATEPDLRPSRRQGHGSNPQVANDDPTSRTPSALCEATSSSQGHANSNKRPVSKGPLEAYIKFCNNACTSILDHGSATSAGCRPMCARIACGRRASNPSPPALLQCLRPWTWTRGQSKCGAATNASRNIDLDIASRKMLQTNIVSKGVQIPFASPC